MTLTSKARLTLPSGDIGSPNDPVQGVFEFAGNVNIVPSFRTGFLVGGRGSQVNNVLQSIAGGDGEKGKGFFLDLGGGAHIVEIQFRGWTGATDSSGNDLTWGDTSAGSYADATGEGALTQLNTLEQYLRHIKIDSNSSATLEYGEFSSSGKYSSLDVVLEGPQFTNAADQGGTALQTSFDGTLTMIEAAVFSDVYSAVKRNSQ